MYKRCLPVSVNEFPVAQRIVRLTEIVQDRLALRLNRALCSCGCRFCQAGMTYRPDQQIVKQAGRLKSSYDEVSLTSSTTDHSPVRLYCRMNSLRKRGVRIIRFNVWMRLAKRWQTPFLPQRRGGLTFAPEKRFSSACAIMSNKKHVTEDDLESQLEMRLKSGWRRMRALLFMMGLPTKPMNIQAGLRSVFLEYRSRERWRQGRYVSASVANIAQVLHAIQWVDQISREAQRERQYYCLLTTIGDWVQLS